MAREPDAIDKAELEAMIAAAQSAGQKAARKARAPTQELQATPEGGSAMSAGTRELAAPDSATGGAPGGVAKAKPKLKINDELLASGMRVVCGFTWQVTSLFVWLFSDKKLEPLTEDERKEWVIESMGFARAIPQLMLVAAVLGFPAWFVGHVTSKLVPKKAGQLKSINQQPQEKATPAST